MKFKDGYDFQNKLRLIVYSMVAAPLVFFAIIYLRSKENQQTVTGEADPIVIVWNIGWVIAGAAAYFIFHSRLKTIRDLSSLEEKIQAYFKSTMYKFSLLETAMLLSVAGYFITLHQLFVFGFIMSLFVFSIENPSLRKIIRRLRLNKEERKRLLEKNGLQ